MKRQSPHALVQAIALLFPLQVFPLQGLAQNLPAGFDLQGGQATIATSGNQLQINQTTPRAVLGWSSFDIGPDSSVRFNHADQQGMTLNIVDGTSASLISGSLTADDSVYLINPHGLTITQSGSVDTGGAFVASTLSVNATNFMNGSSSLSFSGNGSALLNHGNIRATDVVLLGSRVTNSGTIVAPMGRVALASGSQATLDFHGGGFLQVLAPASVTGTDALVTHSGEIVAEGGLVQLQAATAQAALREAVHMPGTVRAQSVSGAHGAIVFHGGEGGVVDVAGGVMDVSPQNAGGSGGQIEVEAAVLRGGIDGVTVGPRGQFSLSVDNLSVEVNSNPYAPNSTTLIVDGHVNSGFHKLLTAGTDVSIRARDQIQWAAGLMIGSSDIQADANGQAGNLTLFAGHDINMGGTFSTYNGDWTLSAGREISMYAYPQWTSFVNNNGHLRLALRNEGIDAYGMQLPLSYAGSALTATIDPGIPNYEEVGINLLDNVDVTGAVTLTGHLRATQQQVKVSPVKGATVNWTTETTGGRLAGNLLTFIEGGVVTRFGRGELAPIAPGVDAVRLELGSNGTISRQYGDNEPDQLDIGTQLFSLAAHNNLSLAPDSTFDQVLAPGSIAVTGPGVEASVGSYTLSLSATADIAWHEGDQNYGVGQGFWVDLSAANAQGASVNLQITPRPVSAEFFNPTYTYGSPQAALRLDGVINNDDVRPLGLLNGADHNLNLLTGGYGVGERVSAGSHTIGVSGISGADAGNYSFDAAGAGQGTLQIDRKLINYGISNTTAVYSEQLDILAWLDVLADDDVTGDVELRDSQGAVVDPESRPGVGEYELSFFGLSGPAADNYELAGSGNYEGQLTITPKPLTWHVDDMTSVYGTLPDLGFATLDGVLVNDEVVAPVSTVSALLFNSPVGHYWMGVSSLTGRSASNYKIAVSGNHAGTLQITPRPLTWSTLGGSSEYGTLPSPNETVVFTDLVGDDEVGATAGLFFGPYPVTLDERLDVGTYNVRALALHGADAQNYRLATSGNQPGEWQITPRALTWSVGNSNVEYGSTTPPNSHTLHGVLAGDTVSGELRLFVDDEIVVPNGPRLPAGNYDVVVHSLSGTDAANYALGSSGNTSGTLRIDRRLLTWDLADGSVVYGNSLQTIGYTLNELLSGDQVEPVISAMTHSFTTRPDVGNWQSYVTGLTGADAGNYLILDPFMSAAGSTGALTVTPRPLRYFAGFVDAMYGNDIEPVFNVSGLLEGDELPVMQYVLTRDGQDVGTGYSDNFFVPYERLSAGEYTIEPRFVRGSNASMRNYTFAVDPATQQYYTSGRVTVNPKPLEYRIWIGGARQVDGHESFHDYEAVYLTLGPNGNGRPLSVRVSLEGVLFNDDVTVDSIEPNIPVSQQGYYQVGTYPWIVTGLSGEDAGNYSRGFSKSSRLIINPAPIAIRGFSDPVTYGSAADAVADLRVFATSQPATVQRALDEGHLIVNRQALGFQLEYQGRQHFQTQLPINTPVGTYPIVHNAGTPMFHGPDSHNFAPYFIPSDFLTIRPKELTVTATDLELTYGGIPTLDDIFALSGIVPGDRVALATSGVSVALEEADGSRVFWGPGNLMDAGDFTVTSRTPWLRGDEATNYTLPEVSARVLVNQKRLHVDMDSSVHYGEFNLKPSLEGVLAQHESLFLGRSPVDYSLRGADGEIVDNATETWPFDKQPDVGMYTLDVGFPDNAALQRILPNYELPPTYEIEVEQRPVRVISDHGWQSYGLEHQAPFRFIYGNSGTGFLPGDDVRPEFRVYPYRWQTAEAEAEAERVFDEYLPVGRYDAFLIDLEGSKAHNYVLEAPVSSVVRDLDGTPEVFDYYHRSGLEIYPKLLSLSEITRPDITTYGEVIPLVGLEGVLPGDDLTVITQRRNTQLEAVLSNDVVWDASMPSVGEYDYTFTGFGGVAGPNYELASAVQASAAQASAEIVPREVHYAVANVIGHYGNFAACADPSDPYLCTYKLDRDGVGQPDIWAPLELGRVSLSNLIQGDDVTGDIVLIDPFDASTLTLDDKPVPGIYLQAVEGLTGRDAHNYRIAEADNVPGVLNIQPRWVRWWTGHGFYSKETGIVTRYDEYTDSPSPTRGSLRVGDMSQSVDSEHLSGLTPVVGMFLDGRRQRGGLLDDYMSWEWARPGIYTTVVVGIEGEYADYYRPVPPEFLPFGSLGFFHVISLDNHEGEINSAILDRRAQQIDEARERRRPRPVEDSLPPEPEAPSGEDARDDEVVNVPPSDDDDNLNFLSDDYLDVLFNYGITGVSLELGAGGEIGVEYEFGPGYVRAGADVEAGGKLQFSYDSLGGSGSVRAGVDIGTGVEGDLGDLGRGSADLAAEANAFAKGAFTYTFENGRFVYRNEAMTGFGGQASGGVGIEGRIGSANVKTTIYSPGTVGAGFSSSAGYDDGVLSFNIEMSLGLGLFGGSLSFGGSINLLALAGALEDAAVWTARVVTELGCQIGIGDCSNPSPEQVYQARLETGREVNRVAESMRHSTSISPQERYEYLKNNPEWVMGSLDGPAQRSNSEFFNTYTSMMDDLREFHETQARLKEQFDTALATGDTYTATRTMTEMTVWNSLDSLMREMNEKGRRIGVDFRVEDGELVLRGENEVVRRGSVGRR